MSSTSSSASSSDSEPPTATKRKLKDVEDSDADDTSVDQAQDDLPVLSHAEQRRQKKKQHKIPKPAQDTDKKPAKLKNSAELAPSKIPKRQNSVWVGNLSFKTTPVSLRSFFDGAGEVTRVHMPMKLASAGPGERGAVKENRGFAYVDFASPDAKTIAITLSENHLDGRRLLIKDGDDFAGRPSTSAQGDGAGDAKKDSLTGHTKTAQKILASQKQPAGPTLFLGNLGFETTEQSIREMLESHRTKVPVASADEPEVDAADAAGQKMINANWIRKIRMGTFEDSGKCKGWAFVDFTNTEHATAALTNTKNHFLDGRKLVVEFASPEAVRRGGGGPRPEKGKGREAKPGEAPDAAPGADNARGGPRTRERVRPVRKREFPQETDEGAVGDDEGHKAAKKRRTDEGEAPARAAKDWRERDGRPKVRAKPGAALAMAKRETASIVPSKGKKIVF